MPTNDSTPPSFAADTNFSAGTYTGDPVKVEPSSGELGQGFVPGLTFFAGFANHVLNKIVGWLNDSGRSLFGDGSDGAVTLAAGTTTLTRDMFYETLTVPNGSALSTAGYRVFVRDLLTVANGGIIQANGGAGLPGNGSGRAGGIGGLAGELGGGGAGGTTSPSTAGGAASGVTGAIGGAGGAGGASNDTGTDASEAGGAGGSVTAPASSWRYLPALLGSSSLRGGAGGGGGGGGDDGDGGSGGGGGGVLVVCAFRASLAGTGCLRADGGTGGAGYTGPDAAGNGGGGGGGGGAVIFVRRGRSGSGTLQAAGGAGGAGFGVGSNGVAGSAGTTIEVAG